jgi:hypothetical protein
MGNRNNTKSSLKQKDKPGEEEMHLIPTNFCEELELVYINVTMKS